MLKNPRMATVFAIVFINLLGFSIILPLLAYYADAYGASDFVTGVLVASYAAAQLIGAPVMGRLSDQYGRRPLLIASLIGTFIGFVILGAAEPLGILSESLFKLPTNTLIIAFLFIGRIIDGISGGNLSIAQAYIADITTPEERSKGLGLIGMAFGLGFIMGPAIGGFLSQYGYAVPAYVAAGITGIALIAAVAYLKESLTRDDMAEAVRESQIQRQTTGRTFSFAKLKEVMGKPLVGPLMGITFFYYVAFVMLQTIFSLYVLRRFGLEADSAGYILAYVGIISALTQGVIVGKLTERFSEFWIIVVGIVVMAFGLLTWGLAPSILWLLISMLPIAVSGGTLNTVLRSVITKLVDRREVGGVLGIQTSAESLTRVIGPTIGGLLIGQFGTSAPGIFGAVVLVLLLPYAYSQLIRHRPSVTPEPSAQPHK